jgi:fructose-1,6-bisphosphatase I
MKNTTENTTKNTTENKSPQSLTHYLTNAHAPPELITVFNAIASAGKQIRSLVLVASLQNIYGSANTINIHNEETQKLDLLSNTILKKELFASNVVGAIASEEDDTLSEPESPPNPTNYAVLIDPLDGSSNIDVNISVGTIFAIYNRDNQNSIDACLQPGRNQIAAGYILYGTATLIILTLKQGVIGFTYDPVSDTFLLSHPTITIPNKDKYYSINEGNTTQLLPESISFITHAKNHRISTRYVGSLVADFHRNLLKGGIYLYPGLKKNPNGKLRLLYEGNPLALICEQAGGKATNGSQNILDIIPNTLHQRTPLFIGNQSLVERITIS